MSTKPKTIYRGPVPPLLDAVQAAKIAASRDVTRPHLNGVHLSCNGGDTFVEGTDGHRLHAVRIKGRADKPARAAIVSLPDVERLAGILAGYRKVDDAQVADTMPTERRVLLEVESGGGGGVSLMITPAPEIFPPTHKVVPSADHVVDDDGSGDATAAIALDHVYVAGALRAAKLVAGDYARYLVFTMGKDSLAPIRLDVTHPDWRSSFVATIMPVRHKGYRATLALPDRSKRRRRAS